MEINGRQLSIISEALGGTNVDNCPHACVARPCGPLAKCVPILENYECQCNPSSSIQCNKAEELPSPSFEPPTTTIPPKILSKKKNNDEVVNQISPERSNEEFQRSLEFQFLNESGDNATGNDSTIVALSASNSSKQKNQKNMSAGNAGSNGDMTNSNDGRLVGDNELNGEMLNDDVSDDDYDDDYYYYDNVDESVAGNDDSNDGNYRVATETERPGGRQTDNIPLPSTDDDRMKFINENLPKKMRYSKDNGIMSNGDDGNSGVTRVLGKYMFVDNEELMRKTKLQEGYSTTKDNYDDVALNSPPTNRKMVKKINKISPDNRVLDSLSADHQQYNIYSGEDVLSTKQLIDDMERIMKNGNDIRSGGGVMAMPTTSRRRTKTARISHGACFTGTDSYFHYNDEATMRHIDGYKIDLNLRFKTHSNNGLILWTGRRSSLEGDDFLSLGIENG